MDENNQDIGVYNSRQLRPYREENISEIDENEQRINMLKIKNLPKDTDEESRIIVNGEEISGCKRCVCGVKEPCYTCEIDIEYIKTETPDTTILNTDDEMEWTQEEEINSKHNKILTSSNPKDLKEEEDFEEQIQSGKEEKIVKNDKKCQKPYLPERNQNDTNNQHQRKSINTEEPEKRKEIIKIDKNCQNSYLPDKCRNDTINGYQTIQNINKKQPAKEKQEIKINCRKNNEKANVKNMAEINKTNGISIKSNKNKQEDQEEANQNQNLQEKYQKWINENNPGIEVEVNKITTKEINQRHEKWRGAEKSNDQRVEISQKANRPMEKRLVVGQGSSVANAECANFTVANVNTVEIDARKTMSRRELKEKEREIRKRIERKSKQRIRRDRLSERVRLLEKYEEKLSPIDSTESSGEEDEAEHYETLRVIGKSEKGRRNEGSLADIYKVYNSKNQLTTTIDNIISIKTEMPVPLNVKRSYQIQTTICDGEATSRSILITDLHEDGTKTIISNRAEIIIQPPDEKDPAEIARQIRQLPSTSTTEKVQVSERFVGGPTTETQGPKIIENVRVKSLTKIPRREIKEESEKENVRKNNKSSTSKLTKERKSANKRKERKPKSSSESSEEEDPTYKPKRIRQKPYETEKPATRRSESSIDSLKFKTS